VRRTTILPKVRELWRLSERRACAVLDINRKMLWYQPVKRDDPVLRARIREIAWQRVRYGHKRIAVLLRREGWVVNLKRVRRIYREENLSIRTKTPKRRRAAVVRQERVVPTAPNQSWAMDFMHDVLADGAKIRLLTIVDSFSRESLALEVAVGFKSTDVVEVLRRLVIERGTPQRIHCDNELSSNVNTLGPIANVGRAKSPMRESPSRVPRRRNSSDHDDTRSLRASLHRA
jgi:putative transposase